MINECAKFLICYYNNPYKNSPPFICIQGGVRHDGAIILDYLTLEQSL